MIVPTQLAAADSNLASDLEQKTNKMGKECFDTAFSKITNHWSAKPIKVAKNREKFHDVVTCSVEVAKIGLHLEWAILPLKIEHQNQIQKKKK